MLLLVVAALAVALASLLQDDHVDAFIDGAADGFEYQTRPMVTAP